LVYIKKKVVDLEIKSDRVQALITQIVSNMLNLKQNSLQIETPSFLINYSIRNLSDSSHMVKLMNNYIKLPSSFVSQCKFKTLSTIAYLKVFENILKFTTEE
jgi:hypothetical protein